MIGREALHELHAKYTEIAALRRNALTRAAAQPRMAALAAQFPGALRELDMLPWSTIEARLSDLEAALRGRHAALPWMVAQARYHALARGALATKRWLGRTRHVDDARRRHFREAAAGAVDGRERLAWAEHLSAVAAPAGGRLMPLVVARVAAQLGISEREARSLILPDSG